MSNKIEKTELYTSEIVKTVSRIIKQNDTSDRPISIELIGEAGIGKTSVIEEIAEKTNKVAVKVNPSNFEEVGDLIGFPTTEFEIAYKVKDQVITKYVDKSIYPHMIQKGCKPTGRSKMVYTKPEFIAEGYDKLKKNPNSSGVILILDDWTRTEPRFIQALMEVLDRHETIGWKLPKGWSVIATANPDNGKYSVASQDEAQSSRYVSLNMKFDLDYWSYWAEKANVDGRCINFLLSNPECLQKNNVRSFTKFFDTISGIKDFNNTADLSFIRIMAESSVDASVAALFTTFVQNNLDKVPKPDWILTEPDFDKVVKSLKSCLSKTNQPISDYHDHDYSAQVCSILVTRIANQVSVMFETSPNSNFSNVQKRINELVESNLFTVDNIYLMIKNVLATSKGKLSGLMTNPKLVQLITS